MATLAHVFVALAGFGLYLLIGGVVIGILEYLYILDLRNDTERTIWIFFWPLLIGFFLVMAIVKIPATIAKKIGRL